MKRLGKYSGRIYTEDDFYAGVIEECCTLITDDKVSDERWIKDKHVKDLLDCVKCSGCPLSQR